MQVIIIMVIAALVLVLLAVMILVHTRRAPGLLQSLLLRCCQHRLAAGG